MRQYMLGVVLLLVVVAVPSVAHAKCSDPPRPQVNWQGCDKQRANLTGARLMGANLRDAKLMNADLSMADLTGAKLTGANLTGAKFINTKMLNADLTGADLTGANLNGANLSCVIFTGATLSRAQWNTGRMCDDPSPIGRCKIVYTQGASTWMQREYSPLYYPRPGANDHCGSHR
jgi:hypothetical protein